MQKVYYREIKPRNSTKSRIQLFPNKTVVQDENNT